MIPCFYCGEITTSKHARVRQDDPRNVTVEHVIPQWVLRQMDPARVYGIRVLNTVKACQGCNSYKGNLSPLDWLVIMPSGEGASRLGELLIKLGCTIDEVSGAMGRRKK